MIYSMVTGTTFKAWMLKSYTAHQFVEDGKYKVVMDAVFSNQGETNVLYSDYAGAMATFTAFYEGWMVNIVAVIAANKATYSTATVGEGAGVLCHLPDARICRGADAGLCKATATASYFQQFCPSLCNTCPPAPTITTIKGEGER